MRRPSDRGQSSDYPQRGLIRSLPKLQGSTIATDALSTPDRRSRNCWRLTRIFRLLLSLSLGRSIGESEMEVPS